MNHLDFGAQGEQIAADYLAKKGWRLLGRNIVIGRGELDIVAMDGDELVVVEVRTRRIGKLTPAELSVGPHKLRNLIKTGRRYVDRARFGGNWRIDVVAVTEDEKGRKTVELFSDITAGMEGGFMG